VTTSSGLSGRAPSQTEHDKSGAALCRVLLHLARSHEFPQGSAAHGYEIVVPLTASGRLDADMWKDVRNRCSVRRFWGAERDRRGFLVHRAGGAEGATWLIDYDRSTDADDEAGYRLGSHSFAEGEYVSIRDEDGELHTFKVASVRPA
jgi:hypothetical protein